MTEPVSKTYTLVEDLAALIDTIKPDSIVSRTFFKSDHMKGILFGFDTGQELSEHTSSQAAVVQIVKGEATITLDDDTYELSAGSWLQLPPRLKHSVYAKTPLVLLLMMFGKD